MEVTRKVRIRRLTGYRDGEIVDLPESRALTYCRNGQADPDGWEDEGMKPMNRMMDTSRNNEPVSRKKAGSTAGSKTKKKAAKPASKSDSGE